MAARIQQCKARFLDNSDRLSVDQVNRCWQKMLPLGDANRYQKSILQFPATRDSWSRKRTLNRNLDSKVAGV